MASSVWGARRDPVRAVHANENQLAQLYHLPGRAAFVSAAKWGGAGDGNPRRGHAAMMAAPTSHGSGSRWISARFGAPF